MPTALALAIVLSAPVPPGPPPVLPVDWPVGGGPAISYHSGATERWRSNIRLPAEAQQVYDTEYRSSGYFGAFALAKAGGWGYASGTNSLEAAREIAMLQCQSQNIACVIVAELLPKSYAPPPNGMITLSEQLAAYYDEAASYAGFKALAVSEDGAYSMYWEMPSRAEADRAALADCEANRERAIPGLSDMPCVLVRPLP